LLKYCYITSAYATMPRKATSAPKKAATSEPPSLVPVPPVTIEKEPEQVMETKTEKAEKAVAPKKPRAPRTKKDKPPVVEEAVKEIELTEPEETPTSKAKKTGGKRKGKEPVSEEDIHIVGVITTTDTSSPIDDDDAVKLINPAAPSSSQDPHIILQLNVDPSLFNNGYDNNFERSFFQYQPNVDVPDAFDQTGCNGFSSQPFALQHTNHEDDEMAYEEDHESSSATAVVASAAAATDTEDTPQPQKTPKRASGNKTKKGAASQHDKEPKHARVFDHLAEFVSRDEWPINSSVSCFWCCHGFHNSPYGLPLKYVNNKFHVFGCFCSLECTASYNFYSNEIKHDVWESFNLINQLARKLNYQDAVQLAPPRHMLKTFGGYMTIDEYRAFCKSSKLINSHTYPMVAMIQQLEEMNDNDSYQNRKNLYIPIDKQKLVMLENKVKLERTKPLYNKKNTLDHTMNLQMKQASKSVPDERTMVATE
jgi:hypothetical protein